MLDLVILPNNLKISYVASILMLLVLMVGCQHNNELPPTLYDQADVGQGGKIYDEFWSEQAGYDQSDPNIALFESNPDFYQCSKCHGWDGLGANGALIGRTPTNTTPYAYSKSLFEIGKTKTEQELFDAINRSQKRRALDADLSGYDPTQKNEVFDLGNSMPDVSNVLTDRQIWALVKFIKTGITDVSELYDADYNGIHPNGSFTFMNIGRSGDASTGIALYNENCAGCHGGDGTSIKIDGLALGGFLRTNPEIVHHKAKYGAPGSEMEGNSSFSDGDLTNVYKALGDENSFPTEVPTIVSYSNQIQPIYSARCVSCHNPTGIGAALDLTEGASYQNIVPSYIGDPASSSPIYTIPSPDGSHLGKYNANEAQLVLDWIEQGAENN